MSISSVKVTFEKLKTKNRIQKAVKEAQLELSKVALKDCLKYTKEDTGDLIESGEKESNLKKGLLIWDTVYARKQYYLQSTKTVINPHAHFMWAHHAASQHGS
jgi:hypothetical protein